MSKFGFPQYLFRWWQYLNRAFLDNQLEVRIYKTLLSVRNVDWAKDYVTFSFKLIP